MDSLGKKQLSLDPPGTFTLLVAVLVGTGGGSVGNAGGTEDNHSGSESNTERGGGRVCAWGRREAEGRTEFCWVLAEEGILKSSSKVTHC